MEIGHGFTDSQVQLDSHPCKLATPQLKTCGILPLVTVAQITEIFLLPCNWHYSSTEYKVEFVENVELPTESEG